MKKSRIWRNLLLLHATKITKFETLYKIIGGFLFIFLTRQRFKTSTMLQNLD